MIVKKIKYIFGILIGIGFIVNFTNGAGYTRQVGSYGYLPNAQSYNVNFTSSGNPLTEFGGLTKQMFLMRNYSSPKINYIWWWNNSGLPYIYMSDGSYENGNKQGTISSYSICDEILSVSSTSAPGNCSSVNVSETTHTIFGNYLKSITNDDYFYFGTNRTSSIFYSQFCFSSNSLGHSLCFDSNSLTGSLGLEYGLDFDTINTSYLYNPPSISNNNSGSGNNFGSGNQVGMTLSSTGSSIYYYESQLGFNKDICYVGVNSMSTLYGTSGISFNQGGGLTIFDAFQTLYGSTGLNEVYVWINNWLLNYEQWFGNDGNPMFLSNYNSGTNQVDIYYDNLTFPFANNPVAVYFMASYIEQVFANSKYDPSGSAVVSYCNMKINDGTFEEIVDNADKININKYVENANINKGLNPDGTEKDYGAWLSSGVNIAFSGNTSIKDTLINFLDETEESIKSLKGNTGSVINGHILPSWLIGAFLFFALFKFIRKR